MGKTVEGVEWGSQKKSQKKPLVLIKYGIILRTLFKESWFSGSVFANISNISVS